MTTNDLGAIRKLTDAATAGPWVPIVPANETDDWFDPYDDPMVVTSDSNPGNYCAIAQEIRQGVSDGAADVAFIAAARTLVPALCDEVEQLRAEIARCRVDERNTIAADIENMPINLEDEGWQHLERKAIEANYPAEWVRRRRTRDDFTTATIEASYQYGYRQAAKVARVGVSR